MKSWNWNSLREGVKNNVSFIIEELKKRHIVKSHPPNPVICSAQYSFLLTSNHFLSFMGIFLHI